MSTNIPKVKLPRIEGTTLHAADDHTIDLDMPRAMDLNRVYGRLQSTV